MNSRKILAQTFLFSAMLTQAAIAHALPADICEIRAAMVSAAAVERDKGVSKKKIMALTLKKLGAHAKGFSGYVDFVYDNPDISPEMFRKLTYISCVNE